jgi:hypothetical protein
MCAEEIRDLLVGRGGAITSTINAVADMPVAMGFEGTRLRNAVTEAKDAIGLLLDAFGTPDHPRTEKIAKVKTAVVSRLEGLLSIFASERSTTVSKMAACELFLLRLKQQALVVVNRGESFKHSLTIGAPLAESTFDNGSAFFKRLTKIVMDMSSKSHDQPIGDLKEEIIQLGAFYRTGKAHYDAMVMKRSKEEGARGEIPLEARSLEQA